MSNVGATPAVSAGDHTVSLQCSQTSGPSGDASVGNADLLVWTLQ